VAGRLGYTGRMSAFVQEWLNLLIRWAHVLAAIMWIGDSFLFMWMDSHLSQPSRRRDGEVVGELWMTHSGGFYEVIKRKSLAQGDVPAALYWFKWESYTTWVTGLLLLVIVYHLNGAALLIGPGSPVTAGQAIALSLALLPLGYLAYEGLWRTPLAHEQRAFGPIGLAVIAALAYGLTQVFSARGAFLQLGAMVGTVMAANVFFRIIPAQRRMLAATRAGQPVDTRYGARAKGRSVHNHYLTLPVLFTMLSNHFPSIYGHAVPWLMLALLFVVGAGLKYAMNFRRRSHPLALGGTVAALAAVVVMTRPAAADDALLAAYRDQPQVSFATVEAIVTSRCASCHAERPTSPMFPAPPQGVRLDTPDWIAHHAERSFVRAVATQTMPLGNLTGMTEAERSLLGAWYAQGADPRAPGPIQLPAIAEPTPSP
jgi:uncharacterized membrane protein